MCVGKKTDIKICACRYIENLGKERQNINSGFLKRRAVSGKSHSTLRLFDFCFSEHILLL